MSNIATNTIEQSNWKSKLKLPSKEIIILGLILGMLQVMDAVMTGLGVAHFGSHIEANPIIRMLIEEIGYIPALAVIKSIAIMVVVALCALASSVPWITRAMKAVIAIYLAAAIIPWTAVIIMKII